MLGDGQRIKTIFLVSWIFPGKADTVILLGFECAINPHNLIKIVRDFFFEKIKIFIFFFLMWTTLNFRGRGKTKRTARDIYKRTLDIEFERDRSIGLGSTIDDRQTDTHTHTHTHTGIFYKTHFWTVRVVYRTIKDHKKIEVEFFTIAVLPSLPQPKNVF